MLASAKSGTDTDQDGNRDYRSSPLGKASTEEVANDWIRKGFEHFGIDGEAQLQGLRRAHRTRVAIAWALWRRTPVSQFPAKDSGERRGPDGCQRKPASELLFYMSLAP